MKQNNIRDRRNNSQEKAANQRKEIEDDDSNPIAELLQDVKSNDNSDKFVYVLGKRKAKDNDSLVPLVNLEESEEADVTVKSAGDVPSSNHFKRD